MTEPLGLGRFKALLAAYGAQPERFPEAERDAALALLASSEEARALAQAESALDGVLALAPAPELSPALARKLAELPIRNPRAARRPRFTALWTALGWAAAAAFGVVWGAQSEALERASGDPSAETAAPFATFVPSGEDETTEEDAELMALAVGALPQLEEEP